MWAIIVLLERGTDYNNQLQGFLHIYKILSLLLLTGKSRKHEYNTLRRIGRAKGGIKNRIKQVENGTWKRIKGNI